ncbi:MAG TPA: hypothetical protein VHC49_22250 [Mycobacteriales bacterium]|nr:hypothetical protein [Mycobacteriales bacterium]
MRVRCVKIINPSTGREDPASSWVRVGREYVVIEISTAPGRAVDLRILTDDGTPSYWSAEMFETVSNVIPSNWAAQVRPGGTTVLTAGAWLRPGFWEDYFDFVPDAVAAYDRDLAIMLEDPTPEWAAVMSARIPAAERLTVSWSTKDGAEERPGISVSGLTARHGWTGREFPIRLWPAGAEARYFRLFGEAWEVSMWDVALPQWPRGISWDEALRGTLEFLIEGGCRSPGSATV